MQQAALETVKRPWPRHDSVQPTSTIEMSIPVHRPRVLVFNFFGGIMDRGIPIYAADISEAVRQAGFETFELTCPRRLRRIPRPLRNMAFVLFEQVLTPFVRVIKRCSVTVYPYNSTGVIDSAFGRAIVIVHDLLPNRQKNTSLAARYIRITQGFHVAMRRPICAASERTFRQLRRLRRTRLCPLSLWSNAFYSFATALARVPTEPTKSNTPLRVLLCSGLGPNKDYAGAIRLLSRSNALRHAHVRIAGFGDDAYLARRRVGRLPEHQRDRVTVLPRLTTNELVREYLSSDLVWVHSKHEGFGRWIVEASLCRRPVVASRIGAFRQFSALNVHYYRDRDFDRAIASAIRRGASPEAPDLRAYHAPLEIAVRDVLMEFAPHSVDGRKATKVVHPQLGRGEQ